MGEYRIPKDSAAGRRQLDAAVEDRRGAEDGRGFRAVRRGWCLGDETFRKELLAQMNGRIGAEHYGPERAETALEEAECIIGVELKRRGWTEESLRQSLKGDAGKVRIVCGPRRCNRWARSPGTCTWAAAPTRITCSGGRERGSLDSNN